MLVWLVTVGPIWSDRHRANTGNRWKESNGNNLEDTDMKFDAEFIASREDVRTEYAAAMQDVEHADARVATVLLKAVQQDWALFEVNGRKENGLLDLKRGVSTAYADLIGTSKGQISKCLTILYAFDSVRSADGLAVTLLVATEGPSLTKIYDAAKALLNGEDGEDGEDAPKTFETDCAPIIKRWARRGMSADEMATRFAALVAEMLGES